MTWFEEYDYQLTTWTHEARFKIFVVPDDNNHVFRIHSKSSTSDFSDKIDELLFIFKALCLQRQLVASLNMNDAVDNAEYSVINFGKLMWDNFGNSQAWNTLSGEENQLLLSNDIRNIVDNKVHSEEDAAVYRNFGESD